VLKPKILVITGCAVVIGVIQPLSAQAANSATSLAQVSVTASQNDIFNAGHPTPPLGDGLPVKVTLPAGSAGQAIKVSDATGGVTQGVNSPSSSPDGGYDPDLAMNINSYHGISGIVADPGLGGFLAGVFTSDAEPSGTGPIRLDYTAATGKMTTTQPTYQPAVDQLFFIGDGLTGTGMGQQQQFIVPAGATTLWLGVADAGYYQNDPIPTTGNTGGFTATLSLMPPAVNTNDLYGEPVADSSQFPFVGFLQQRSSIHAPNAPWHTFCSASLVSKYEVLSAQHCLNHFNRDLLLYDFRVVIGRNRISGAGGETRDVYVDFRKGGFKSANDNTAPLINDYMLWGLERPIKDIKPVSLAATSDSALWQPGQDTIALGWGIDKPGQKEPDDQLRAIHEQVTAVNYPPNGLQFETAPNASHPEGITEGDSGGPVVVRRSDGTYVQIGLVSGKYGSSPTDSNWLDLYAATYPGEGQTWIVKHEALAAALQPPPIIFFA